MLTATDLIDELKRTKKVYWKIENTKEGIKAKFTDAEHDPGLSLEKIMAISIERLEFQFKSYAKLPLKVYLKNDSRATDGSADVHLVEPSVVVDTNNNNNKGNDFGGLSGTGNLLGFMDKTYNTLLGITKESESAKNTFELQGIKLEHAHELKMLELKREWERLEERERAVEEREKDVAQLHRDIERDRDSKLPIYEKAVENLMVKFMGGKVTPLAGAKEEENHNPTEKEQIMMSILKGLQMLEPVVSKEYYINLGRIVKRLEDVNLDDTSTFTAIDQGIFLITKNI